ncbi:hypothetical protein CVT25_006219 [Psilocybe cyanescens]|uniref:Poly(A) RNA polymerase mitochondrial-like central palm domain-containing protein n=1 Tax=Psilocybe cyanescens TaxID=93625 RepID=A0A409XKN4_PSICY|nr:hypothetical protein CVT25_006219 [Psilocybe cyanescens]
MAGQPTRTKREADYLGLSIPPCGEFEVATTSISSPPWLQSGFNIDGTRSSKTVTVPSLSKEIEYFMNYMNPSPKEIAIRKDLVKRFTALIETFDENITVIPVGSYVTGLYLPTSDIDMVLTRRNQSYNTSVRTIYPAIARSGFASKVVTVFNASVPVIKVTDKVTGIEIDISNAESQSIKATNAVAKWLQTDTDIIRMLVFVVKTFLMIRRCGTTFTGGINSYVLVWMVVAWVNLEWPKRKQTSVIHSSRARNISSLEESLKNLSLLPAGTTPFVSNSTASMPRPSTTKTQDASQYYAEALKGFLDFYAQKFDYRNMTIRIEPSPHYAVKPYVYSSYPTNFFLLSIFDPANGGIDMGSKVYGINHIKASFREAYSTIISAESAIGRGGILGRMLGGDFTKFIERRADITRKGNHTQS